MADFQGGEERGLRVRMSEQKLVISMILTELAVLLLPMKSISRNLTLFFSFITVQMHAVLEKLSSLVILSKSFRQLTSIWVRRVLYSQYQQLKGTACQVQTKQIHNQELNRGPWDLQHSTLTTGLQQVGCSNPTDTMLLLFCHPCSPAPPLLLGQLHWSLTTSQKLFLALAQYAGPILSCENVSN